MGILFILSEAFLLKDYITFFEIDSALQNEIRIYD